MSDIIERLRKGATHWVLIPCEDLTEAADEIERLRAMIEKFSYRPNEVKAIHAAVATGKEP